MLTRFIEPSTNRIFFVAFDSSQGADPHPLGQQRQRFENLVGIDAPPIEERVLRFAEGLATRVSTIALSTLRSLAELLDVAERTIQLQLPVLLTGGIGTEITNASGLRHGTHSGKRGGPKYKALLSNIQEGDYRNLLPSESHSTCTVVCHSCAESQ